MDVTDATGDEQQTDAIVNLVEFAETLPAEGNVVKAVVGGRFLHVPYRELIDEKKADSHCPYPLLTRNLQSALQHTLSRDDCHSIFVNQSDVGTMQTVYEAWCRNGVSGIWHRLHQMSHNVPILLKTTEMLTAAFESLTDSIPFALSLSNPEEIINEHVEMLSWNQNWVRAIAWHPQGGRLALCQQNDYIRVYNLTGDGPKQAFITLRHARQRAVSTMAWKPHNHHFLAVGCVDCIVVWIIDPSSIATRPPPSAARVLTTAVCPITQVAFHPAGTYLVATSPTSSLLQIYDSLSMLSIQSSSTSSSTIAVPSASGISRCVFSHSGHKLAVAGVGETLSVLLTAPERGNSVFAIYFVANKASTSTDYNSYISTVCDTTEVWSPDEAQAVGGPVQQLTISQDGNLLAVAFKDNPNTIGVFAITNNKPLIRLSCFGVARGPRGALAERLAFGRDVHRHTLTVVWSNQWLQFLEFADDRVNFVTNAQKSAPTSLSTSIMKRNQSLQDGDDD